MPTPDPSSREAAVAEQAEPGAKPTRVRWCVTGWLAGAASIAYLCRAWLGVAEKTIRGDLGLSEQQMGLILSAFFWSYALGQIPAGRLGEHFGPRRCLPAFAALWSVATAMAGLAGRTTGILLLGLERIASGFAQAGLFPTAVLTVSRWYPSTERARVSGVLGAAMLLGAIIGAPLAGELLGHVSWKAIFVLYALPGLLWAVGFAWWFRDRIEDHPAANDAEVALVRGYSKQGPDAPVRELDHFADSDGAADSGWLKTLVHPTTLTLCGQQFFQAAGMAWLLAWFPTFLQESRGVSREAAGWLTTMPLITTMFAALSGGAISDWVLQRTGSLVLARKGVAAGGLLLATGLIVLAFRAQSAVATAALIGSGAFFAAFASPCSYATTVDLGGRRVGTVFATMNMSGNFGAASLVAVAPRFRELVESGSIDVPLAGGNSWNSQLLLYASMYGLSAGCWLLLRMNRSLSDTQPTGGTADD